MANESLEFRKGNLENLATVPVKDGTIIFTLDEKALYLDANSERKRIGNFVEVQTEAELYNGGNLQDPVLDGKTWYTNVLYYVVESNLLLRWTGEEWIRINSMSDAELTLDELQSTVNFLQNTVSEIENNVRSYDSQFENLQSAIDAEQKSRENFDTEVSKQIEALQQKDLQLDNSISSVENSNRTLSEQLEQEVTNRANADSQIREDFAAADETLKEEIKQDYTDAIDAEKTEREAADVIINNTISQNYSELNTLKGTVSNLTEQLHNEITAREATDQSVEDVRGEIARVEKEYKEADQELRDLINILTSTDFSNLEKAVRDNTQNIETLTGSAEVEGSVDYKIQQAIDSLSQGQSGAVGQLREDLEKQIEETEQRLDNSIGTLQDQLQQEIRDRESDIERVESEYAEADQQTLQDAKDYVDSMLSTADAMTFKGVLGSYEIEDLPTIGVSAGDTYKVGENGQYGPVQEWGYIGDLFIALKDQGEEDADEYLGGWAHISSGYEVSFDPTLSVRDADGTAELELFNGINVLKSHIALKPQEKSNVSIIVDRENLTFGLVWGEF